MSEADLATRQVTLTVSHGLHLTPISQLVSKANCFSSSITLSFDGKSADAKSVYDLMLLAAPFGARLTLEARGSDAQNAVDSLSKLFEGGFVVAAD